MRKPKWPFRLLAGALLAALFAGFLYFGGLTKASAYPGMSTLNSGPDGAKLLFDALKTTPPLVVRRNYLPFTQWHPSNTTIFMFSLNSGSLNYAEKNDLAELEQLAQRNNRLVLCIQDKGNFLSPDDPKKPPLVKKRWGLLVKPLPRGKKKKEEPDEFTLEHDSSWTPVAGMDDAVEKRFGKAGVIVIALHGDEFSNDSLGTDDSVLEDVLPLIGPHTLLAFDETHLGVEESGSIAALARRYKLEGLAGGLILLFALFIWNQSVSFPPPSEFEANRDRRVMAADARSTFAGLIARHLTPRALLESCIAEWNRTKPQQRITAGVPAAKFDATAFYREIQETLPKKRSQL